MIDNASRQSARFKPVICSTPVPIKRERDDGVVPTKKERKHPKVKADTIAAHTWYCLRVAPQKEFLVQDMMQSMGFLTYVPVRKEWKFGNRANKARREKKLFSYPQMVGYVFVGFASQQMHRGHTPCWATLFERDAVLGAVGINNTPMQINKDSLARLAQAHPNGLQRPSEQAFMRTHGEYAIGDMVRICEGPFDGYNAPVVDISKSKAVIRLEMFGGSRELVIDTFSLEKAK